MNIIFKDVRIKNFMSFQSAYIELDNQGFTLVEGVNNNPTDNAKSNGSGKSTLFESIVWALTGTTIRGTTDVNNIYGNGEGCSVNLLMEVDGNEYRIVRYKDDVEFKNNLKLYINGEDISGKGLRETQQILEQHLPDVDIQFLGSVVVLGQGLPQRFTNNTPSGRKAILENLSKSDYMVEEIKNRLTERKATLQNDINEISKDISNRQYVITNNQQTIKDNELKIQDLKNYNNSEKLAEIDLQISRTNDGINNSENTITLCKEDINTTNEQLEIFEKELNDLISTNTTIFKEYEKASKELSDYDNQTTALSVNIQNIQKEITKLKNVQTVCPTCGRPFEGIFKPDTSSLENDVTLYTKELESRKNDRITLYNTLEQKGSFMRSISIKQETLKDNIKQCKTTIKNKKDIIYENLNRQKGLSDYISDLKIEKTKIEDEAKTVNTKIQLLEEENEKLNKNVEKTELDIVEYRKQLDTLNERFECVNKLLSYCSREFRGYLLLDCINYIQERAKHYARTMFNNDYIEFVLDSNAIKIRFCNKDYENLSGGERQKIDLIVQFALRDMLISTIGFSCNILVLDEVFDNLDSIGCDKLIDLIINNLNDISSVFIITHHSDIAVPTDKVLRVTKLEQGYSIVETVS
jgi:DNA repair exonuclease SbcCD ATPase subunit